jgi:hypothetical protein
MAPVPRPSEPPIPRRYFLLWLLRVLAPGRPRFLLVRSTDRGATAALLAEFLDLRRGVACVVADPGEVPPAYQLALASTRTWSVLRSIDVPGTVDETARSMAAANTLVLDSDTERVVRSLWLPPSVLAGYSSLPATPDSVLVVDDWAALESEYLAVPASELVRALDRDELDRLFVDAFRVLAGSHLVLATTWSSRILEDAADAVLDVHRGDAFQGGVEAWIAKDVPDPTRARR